METEALRALVQEAEVATDPETRLAHAVDGLVPEAVLLPGEQEALAGALAAAARYGLAVAPRGGGSKGGLGAPPSRLDVVLSTARLNRVVAYEPADLTITVEAGMTLAELRSLLGKHGQALPLDPPDPERATVGGVVAANAMGPWRLAYGAVRDLVLGLRVALPDGRHIRTGGRVVKNVAGYDMNKLFVGALGTLGVITEVTLKLRPLPEAQETVLAGFDVGAACLACAEAVLNAELEPSAMVALSPGAAFAVGAPGPHALAVAVEGLPANVRYQAEQMRELIRRHGGQIPVAPPAAFWEEIRHFADRYGSTTVCKVATVIGQVGAEMAKVGPEEAAVAWVGSGQVYLHARGRDEAALRSAAEVWLEPPAEGSAVLERAPAGLRRALPVWGAPGPAFPLMAGLKRSFDPAGILNPGRFLGGL